MTHLSISKLTIIGSDNGLSPGWRQSHYLNQCWNIVNCTLRNKLQWNLNLNPNIFMEKIMFQNVVCEMSILSQPQCVNSLIHLIVFIHSQHKCSKEWLMVMISSVICRVMILMLWKFWGINDKFDYNHGWPSTQPGSLHTALQRKYTQPCSLFSWGTAVSTIGHGCVQVPGCVEGHPW